LVLLGPAAAMGWAALTVLLALPAAHSFRSEAPARPVGAEMLAAVRARAPALLTLLMAASGLEVSMRAFPGNLVPAAALVAIVALRGRRRLDPPGPRDRDPLVAGRARMVRPFAPRTARRLIDRATATGAVTMGAMKPLWSALALAFAAQAAEQSLSLKVEGWH